MSELDLGPTSADWLPTLAAPYREAVKRLTAQNRELRELYEAAQRARVAEVKALKAQLREGLTPELIALRKEVTHWRDRAVTAEGRLLSERRSADGAR